MMSHKTALLLKREIGTGYLYLGGGLSPRACDRAGCCVLMEALGSWGSTWSSQESESGEIGRKNKKAKKALKMNLQVLYGI